MEEIIRKIFQQAKPLGSCKMFTGDERTVEDIIKLFTDPQGIEFCIKKNFPDISTYRAFEPWFEEGRKHGIYIDAGAITLQNPKLAVLIGNTQATVVCDTVEDLHRVVALQGAKCNVIAWKWAVVRVRKDDNSTIIKSAHNNAIIL